MKNTENFTNRILKRVDQSSPLTWEQLDNNNLYANTWKIGVTYKKSMIVLWNDNITMGGENSVNGHSSFWIYISTNENTISSDSNRPGTTGGAAFWHRLESFLSSGAISGNNINLTMNDGTIVAIPLNNPTFTGAVTLPNVNCYNAAGNGLFYIDRTINGGDIIFNGDEVGNTYARTVSDKTDNTDKLATTAFVQAQKYSPTFTGSVTMTGASSVTAPTVVSTDNDTTVATTAFVQAQKDSPTFIGNVNISHVNNNVSAGQVFAIPGTKIVNGSSANFTDFSIGDTIIISYSPTFTTTIVEITSDNLITVYADIPTNSGYPYNYYITRNSIKYKSDFNANNGAINMTGATSVKVPNGISQNDAVNISQMTQYLYTIAIDFVSESTPTEIPQGTYTIWLKPSTGSLRYYDGIMWELAQTNPHTLYYDSQNTYDFYFSNGEFTLMKPAPTYNPTFTGVVSGIRKNVEIISVNKTLGISNDYVLIGDSGIEISLPNPSLIDGKEYTIKSPVSLAGVAPSIICDGYGYTIDGNEFINIPAGNSITVVSLDSNWHIINRYIPVV